MDLKNNINKDIELEKKEKITQDKDESYKLEVVANKDTVLLFFISRLYKLDYATLLFLYEKLDKDIYYIFYLFSGKKISFPTSSKFQSLVFSSDNVTKFLKDISNDNITLTNEEQDLASELNNILDLDKDVIVVPIDVVYNME